MNINGEKSLRVEGSVVVFPVQDLVVVVFGGVLDSLVLWLDEPVPLCPAGVLLLQVALFVGVSLLEADQFVEVCEHVNEDAGLLAFRQKVV